MGYVGWMDITIVGGGGPTANSASSLMSSPITLENNPVNSSRCTCVIMSSVITFAILMPRFRLVVIDKSIVPSAAYACQDFRMDGTDAVERIFENFITTSPFMDVRQQRLGLLNRSI